MNYALQVHEAKYVFPIPDGLKELSSDIIREVLRHQPSHINGFIADYLETMLVVRGRARGEFTVTKIFQMIASGYLTNSLKAEHIFRYKALVSDFPDSGVVICEAFQEACYFDEIFKIKSITRAQAQIYATTIQAGWRGYVVRKKICLWLKKKKKFEEEKARKRSLKIEELLAGLGITYDEAKRAAGVIQVAYRESKDKGLITGEDVPLGQRIREVDRIQGRFERWEKEDFGDFFEMDESGGIKYVWPRVGELRKVLREDIPKDVPIVEFFTMRDLNGLEQYSYLIKTQPDTEFRGVPIGFLVPMPKDSVTDFTEAEFVKKKHFRKMGDHIYVFRDDVDKTELRKFEEQLRIQTETQENNLEMVGEMEYDPSWVLPRVLVRIKKNVLQPTDDEVHFVKLTETLICDQDEYTFRAEPLEQTAKIIRFILKSKCPTIEEALTEASNLTPYKVQETGRIFPVETFTSPSYIQKIEIIPESDTAEDEADDLLKYNYIFLPPDHAKSKVLPKGESCFSISITRFQGFHSDYKGSAELQNKVFIMGPKMTTPDGKPFTYESLFWDDFGEVAWHQLLYTYKQEEAAPVEEEEEKEEAEEEENVEELVEKEFETEKVRSSEMGESKEAVTEVTEVDRDVYEFSPPASEIALEGEEKPGEGRVLSQEIQGEEKPEPKKETEETEKEEEGVETKETKETKEEET